MNRSFAFEILGRTRSEKERYEIVEMIDKYGSLMSIVELRDLRMSFDIAHNRKHILVCTFIPIKISKQALMIQLSNELLTPSNLVARRTSSELFSIWLYRHTNNDNDDDRSES